MVKSAVLEHVIGGGPGVRSVGNWLSVPPRADPSCLPPGGRRWSSWHTDRGIPRRADPAADLHLA